MSGFSHRDEIRAAIASEPAASNKDVNFGVQDLERDASQALLSAMTVQGHASSAGRLCPDLGWQIVRRRSRQLHSGWWYYPHSEKRPSRRAAPALAIADQATEFIEMDPTAVPRIERLQAFNGLAAAGTLPFRHALAVKAVPAAFQLAPSKTRSILGGSGAAQLAINGADSELSSPPRGRERGKNGVLGFT
jgi:hypothetical protein